MLSTIFQLVTLGPATVTLQEVADHIQISMESLKQKCTSEPKVLQRLAECCYPMNIVGLQLGLKGVEISDIQQDSITAEEKRLAMLQKWKSKFAYRATYQVLIEALLACKKNEQATEACRIIASGK